MFQLFFVSGGAMQKVYKKMGTHLIGLATLKLLENLKTGRKSVKRVKRYWSVMHVVEVVLECLQRTL